MINVNVNTISTHRNLRTLTNNRQVTSEGTIVEGFESITGWTFTGAGGSMESTSTCKVGTSAIKVTATNSVYTHINKSISQNLSAYLNFIIWIYIEDKTKIEVFDLAFSSDNFATKSLHYNLFSVAYTVLTGWNRLVIDKTLFTAVGGESWSNTMNGIRITFESLAGQTSYAIFDDLRAGYTARPKVIITFDDGYQNNYDNAVLILNANGQKACFFVYHSAIGTSGYMTLAELQTIYAVGHDVGNHTYTHADLTSITESEMHTEIDQMDAYLAANGFESRKFLAYPLWKYNDTVIAYLKTKGIVMARGIYTGAYQAHPTLNSVDNSEYKSMCLYMGISQMPVATTEAYIDKCINQCGLLILAFHQIVNSGASGDMYLTSDFQIISDYLKTKSNAGLLDVENLTQYYKHYQI